MIESTASLYKLIVLYALKRVGFPLTNAQLSELFLTREYTTYMHLQEILTDMTDTGLVQCSTRQQTTFYEMTGQGEQTIEFFAGDLSADLREEIDDYLRSHSFSLRNEDSIRADYARRGGRKPRKGGK